MRSQVVCVITQIVFGCQDGKVRCAQLKTAKAVALYSTNSYVVSMCSRFARLSRLLQLTYFDCIIALNNGCHQLFVLTHPEVDLSFCIAPP